MRSAHGGVVPARSPDRIQIDDHGFVFTDEGEFVIEVVARGDFAARAVDMKKDGGYGVIIGRLTDLEDEVVDHAGSDISWNFLGDDSEEIDFGDAFFLRIISFDKLLLK